MSEQNEHKPLSAREVCEQLEVVDSTFRKWCIFIESNTKHHFTRASKSRNKRLFYPSDVQLLEQFKKLVTVDFMKLEEACKLLFMDNSSDEQSSVPVVPDRSELDELRERLNEQDKKINSLYEYINVKVAERDHLLLEQIRATQEIAAATKKPWWKFWTSN